MQIAETNRHTGSDLIRALRSSDLPAIERLLSIPVNVNMRDSRDVSALMVAAYRGLASTCERLIELGADVLHGVESGQGDKSEFDDAETRSLMSGDPATIRAVHRAAARARWTKWKIDSSSQDLVFILESAARHAMPALCVEILESAVSLKGESSPGDRILSAARESRDWRTFHVIVAMGVEIGDLVLSELVSHDFISAVTDEQAHAEKIWAKEEARDKRRMARDGRLGRTLFDD